MKEIASENVLCPTPEIKPAWSEVLEEHAFNRKEAEEYVRKREEKNEVAPNPEVAYLNKTIFPLLRQAIIEMLIKVKEDDSFYRRNSTLNGLDYLSEVLYNKNPNYPEREENWTYIFDMQWVQDYLIEKPRPYYPFHLIWSKQFAALKIQSFMRGYWDRCRPDIQELRQFWKTIRHDVSHS